MSSSHLHIKEANRMKTVYATIVIIACVVLAIVCWNGITKIDNSPVVKTAKTGTVVDQMSADHPYPSGGTTIKLGANTPIAGLIVGIAGICFGVYSIAANLHLLPPARTKPTKQ